MKSNFDQVRDALLRMRPWNFARRWVNLAMLNIIPIPLDILPNSASPGAVKFTAAYQLPNDYLRLYRFSPKDTHWRIIGRQIYSDAIPSSNSGPLLGLQPLGSDGPDNQPPTPTNVPMDSVGIEYIRRVTDTTEMDPLFIDAFIWKLVKDVSFGVSGLISAYQMAKQELKDAMEEASAVCGMEQWPDEFYNTDLSDVRFGYSGLGVGGL